MESERKINTIKIQKKELHEHTLRWVERGVRGGKDWIRSYEFCTAGTDVAKKTVISI